MGSLPGGSLRPAIPGTSGLLEHTCAVRSMMLFHAHCGREPLPALRPPEEHVWENLEGDFHFQRWKREWEEQPKIGVRRSGRANPGGRHMQNPITTIDLLHSGSPDDLATPWEETRRVLEAAEVFWLSTVRADGRPHVTPVAAAWLDGTLYFQTGCIAQKTQEPSGEPARDTDDWLQPPGHWIRRRGRR